MRMTDREIALAKGMLLRGDEQHNIAALFGENAGRIAEIANGMKPPDPTGKRVERSRDIPPAPPDELPPAGPYFLNLVAERDIILDGLEAVEQIVAEYVARHGEGGRDLQRRYHSALAERRRELWKGRQR